MAKIEQSWEPGTLDKTRKNLGTLSEEEAKKMISVLGGEILQEKSAPIDYNAFPRDIVYAKKPLGKTSNEGSKETVRQEIIATQKAKKGFELPIVNQKERLLFDKLMMSDEYKIKTSYGLFNFVLRFTKGNDHLKKDFITYTLKKDLDHFASFIDTVKSLLLITPASFKEELLSSDETKYVFLRTVGNWSVKDLRYLLAKLQENVDSITVLSTFDFVKTIYSFLLRIYYLGENRIAQIFKECYEDLGKQQNVDKKKILMLSKKAVSECNFVFEKIIKGLYPLLMRMCSKHVFEYQDFFKSQTSNILTFLGMTKYDLILPTKKNKTSKDEEKTQNTNEKKENTKPEAKTEQKATNYVSMGLKVLEQLFPQAGFANLSSHPDMYPYFQPLYQFRDGLNLLSNENPLQITIILLKITEDLLQGCRNIEFNGEAGEHYSNEEDRFTNILAEWALYREMLFEKKYCDVIKEFVNSEYSNPGEFQKSQYGLKLLTDMLWQIRYNFLPYFEFQQLILEKPKNDSPYRPLCIRTTVLKKYFEGIVKSINASESSQGNVLGVQNPWSKYRFDIQTPISKRLNVIFGAKKPEGESKATNANLLKYTFCVISVLDWWLNDKNSPAYTCDGKNLYRVSKEDGAPEFSVALRDDQNDLFSNSIKEAIAKKTGKQND